MPELPQRLHTLLQIGDRGSRLAGACLRGPQIGIDALPAIELPAVVIRQERTALALLLLLGQLTHEAGQQGAAQRPQLAQLIEHQRWIGGIGLAEARFQGLQHFLHAHGRPFLLLDAVLEALDLILDAAVSLLELGTIAKQTDQAVIFAVASARVPA